MQNEEDADSLTRRAPKQDREYPGHDLYRERHPGPRHGLFARNDSEQIRKARIYRGADSDRARREMRKWSGFYLLTIASGQTIELPVEWRDALVTVRGNRVVGGLIPQLRFVSDPSSGEPDPAPIPMHPSLLPAQAPARRRRRPGAEP